MFEDAAQPTVVVRCVDAEVDEVVILVFNGYHQVVTEMTMSLLRAKVDAVVDR